MSAWATATGRWPTGRSRPMFIRSSRRIEAFAYLEEFEWLNFFTDSLAIFHRLKRVRSTSQISFVHKSSFKKFSYHFSSHLVHLAIRTFDRRFCWSRQVSAIRRSAALQRADSHKSATPHSVCTKKVSNLMVKFQVTSKLERISSSKSLSLFHQLIMFLNKSFFKKALYTLCFKFRCLAALEFATFSTASVVGPFGTESFLSPQMLAVWRADDRILRTSQRFSARRSESAFANEWPRKLCKLKRVESGVERVGTRFFFQMKKGKKYWTGSSGMTQQDSRKLNESFESI